MLHSLYRFKINLIWNVLFVIEHLGGYHTRQLVEKIWPFVILKKVKTNIFSDSKISVSQISNTVNKNNNYPIFFKSVGNTWPAVQQWNLSYFIRHFGQQEVQIEDIKGNQYNPLTTRSETLSLAEYLELVKKGSVKYLKFSDLVQKHPELQNQLDLSWIKSLVKPGSFGSTFYLFIGGKGSVTPLHNELPCNVYTQIHGYKTWVLYPPEDRIYLNPRTERRPYFFSSADPFLAEQAEFPLKHLARKIEVTLGPGDALYIPPFWWHYIRNESDSVGVAYKFVNPIAAVRASSLLSLLMLLATRPSIVYTFFANRITKEDVIVKRKLND